MKRTANTDAFEEQFRRIRLVTNTDTPAELAKFLGIDPSEVADAKLRGKIPPGWLVILILAEYVSPEWILTGRGPCYTSEVADHYETLRDEAAVIRADKEALRRLPSGLLAQELVRRIAVAEISGFCRPAMGGENS